MPLRLFVGELDRTFAYQVLRNLPQGADLHECEKAMRGVYDLDQWQDAWSALAKKYQTLAKQAEKNANHVTARDFHAQASIYFRLAEFFIREETPLKTKLYTQCRDELTAASSLLSPRAEKIEIPYEGKSLPGYLTVPESSGPFPVVIVIGGSDDCKEEHVLLVSKGYAERGVATLCFDGPGKGEAQRLRGLVARPDFEKVVAPIIDFIGNRTELDARRVGILGISMGGYYAVRACAFEPRVRCCVLWSAVYDVLEDFFDFYPPIREQLRYITGASDLADARKKLSAYNLRGIANRVKCPTLIVHGEKDFITSVEGAERVYEELQGRKDLRVIKDGEHMAVNFYPEVRPIVWDWLANELLRK